MLNKALIVFSAFILLSACGNGNSTSNSNNSNENQQENKTEEFNEDQAINASMETMEQLLETFESGEKIADQGDREATQSVIDEELSQYFTEDYYNVVSDSIIDEENRNLADYSTFFLEVVPYEEAIVFKNNYKMNVKEVNPEEETILFEIGNSQENFQEGKNLIKFTEEQEKWKISGAGNHI